MGVRGELFTTQVVLDNRSYFFNVKENRTGDVFLQVVESKNKNGENFDRHAIVVFADDMQKFFKGLDESLAYIEKNQKDKRKASIEKKKAREATFSNTDESSINSKKKVYRKKGENDRGNTAESKASDGIKRTGRVHVVSRKDAKKI